MIMISFRTKREREEMLEKAKKMEKFAAEFVDCLENSQDDEYRYDERGHYDDMEEMSYRGGRRMNGRYMYK